MASLAAKKVGYVERHCIKSLHSLSRGHNMESHQSLHAAQAQFCGNVWFFFASPDVAPLGLESCEQKWQIIGPSLPPQCTLLEQGKHNCIITFIQKMEAMMPLLLSHHSWGITLGRQVKSFYWGERVSLIMFWFYSVPEVRCLPTSGVIGSS